MLRKLYPAQVYVEVNPADAKARGIVTSDPVRVESRRGRITATAFVTRSVQPGHVFVPMHYEETNRLTDASSTPIRSSRRTRRARWSCGRSRP